MRIALYPGSFDPITHGHLDVAQRAARLFDKVIIAVYDGLPKRGALFATRERVALISDAIAGNPGMTVETYQGLTIDYARRAGASVLVRGLRVSGDFEYELQLTHMYRSLAPEIEVICLMTNARYSFISSSLIREVASLGGNVTDFVPPPVARALHLKFGRDTHDHHA